VPQWAALSKALGRLGRVQQLQIVYEVAGACGYTLARQLRSRGKPREVIAPAKIARRPGDRIKTIGATRCCSRVRQGPGNWSTLRFPMSAMRRCAICRAAPERTLCGRG
jgi:hypothetical protein